MCPSTHRLAVTLRVVSLATILPLITTGKAQRSARQKGRDRQGNMYRWVGRHLEYIKRILNTKKCVLCKLVQGFGLPVRMAH